MHKKNNVFKKWLAGLAMFGLVASGAVVMAPAANATVIDVPAGGLDFLQNQTIAGVLPDGTTTYTNIDGNGTVAVVQVVSLTNSAVRRTGTTWNLDWTGYAPDGVSYYKMAYTFGDGDAVLSAPVPAGTTTGTVLNVPATTDRDELEFRIRAFDVSDVHIATSSSLTNTSGTVDPGDAGHTYVFEENRFHALDLFSSVLDARRYLASTLRRTNNNLPTKARIKVSFLNSAQTAPVTYRSLAVNAYDIDDAQFVSFENIASYQLTSPTNIDSVAEYAPRNFSFTSKNVGTSFGTGFDDPTATSYSLGRVKVNYQNVSELFFEFGFPADNESSASFQFDFGDGGLWAGSAAPEAVAADPIATPAPPVVAAIDVNPTNVTVDNEIITILGANLNTVTNVFIGGVSVPIFTQTGNRLQVRAPKGLSGPVDLELKSSLNDVLLAKKLNFGSTAAAGTRKATLIVGGFAHNSRKLTARMQDRIDRWLERNSDLSTLTCTGFTSLPRRTTDVTLSTNRGLTACKFSKTERPGLETSVSQGIEDPRPGSNVRRVRLVLTP